jgi:hypothetical protein
MSFLMAWKGTLEWDLDTLATAMRLPKSDVVRYFNDGRRISFILERRLAYEVLNGQLAPTEGAEFDLVDADGHKWEVRSISRSGIYFCPSYMVGSGRSFDESGFLKKLEAIEGYVVSDIDAFPRVNWWQLSSVVVRNWWDRSLLGAGTKTARAKILQLINTLE